jgi:DNA-binding LacI/PurR family transcriptional regulator
MLAKRRRPTALVCFSDEFAIGALRAADLAGVRVPEDLALVGYDDKDCARFARVPLTTMHQPDEMIGKEAVTLLIDRISGKLPDKPIVRTLEARLVIRESCGAKPVNR